MARTPRKPTAAEWTAIKARERIRNIQAGNERKQTRAVARRVQPRKPRPPTPRERNIIASRENVRRKTQRVEENRFTRRPDVQSVAAVEKFKRSQKYGESMLAAKLSKEVQDRLKKARTAPAHTPRVFGVQTWRSTNARDLIPARGSTRKGSAVAPILQTKGRTLAELVVLNEVLKGDRKTQTKRLSEFATDEVRRKETVKRAESGTGKAVAKILDVTLRPTNAIAGATSAALTGKSVAKAAAKGITGKEKKTFSTVLREQGVGKGAGVIGFGLDVLLDPTTYVSFGTASVARKAAAKAARDAAKSAAKASLRSNAAKVAAGDLTKREARRIAAQRGRDAGHTAGRKVLEKAKGKHHTTAVDVRLAGRSVPGVTRGTAVARRGAARATAPVAQTKTAQTLGKALRASASEGHAGVRKVGQTKEAQNVEKALQRETRAQAESVTRHVSARANALLSRLAKSERDAVIDAIEKGTVHKLRGQATKIKTRKTINPREAARRARDVRDPNRLHTVARRVEDDLKYLRRVGRRSGLLTGDIGRQSRSRLETRFSAAPPVASKARTQASLKEARVEQAAARKAIKALPADAKPSVRQAARRRLRHADQRIEFLHSRHRGLSRAEREAETMLRNRAGARARRMEGEAKGYVPRPREEQIADRSTLERIAEQADVDVPVVREGVGAERPTIGASKQRKYRAPRSELRASSDVEKQAAVKDVSNDVRAILQHYGGGVARGSAARNLNTKIVQQLGEKLPKNMTAQAIAKLADEGKSVYRVRAGELEKLDVGSAGAINNISKGGATRSGGQYAILDDAAVRRIREKGATWGQGSPLAQGWDAFQSKWKGLALSTPGYLLRNLTGDFYNAWGDERFWRLARNTARGQKALNDLGKWEKGLRRFQRQMPETKRMVSLTDEQAAQVAKATGMDAKDVGRKLPAMQVALLAERMGVIRQGRFIELMTEGAKGAKPRSTHAWENAVKRTEDSVRIGTFLGGLQRGMSPREAATRASKIHFDYGDLTNFEKGVLRRAMPFYTFSSRNIPLQAKRAVTRPGKLATTSKALEEGRRSTGLAPDFREGQDPYEQKQMGIPIKWGGKTYTVSVGLPFTDLGDIGALATHPMETIVNRVGELLTPFPKVPAEIVTNYSLFFKDQIKPKDDPLTRAPAWAIAMGKGNDPASKAFRKWTGLVPDYAPVEGDEVWGWSRNADYVSRQVPGILGAASKAGPIGVQKGKNARGLSPWQQALAFMGPRVKEYEPNQARINRIYDEIDKVDGKRRLLMRRTAGTGARVNADNPTPEFTALSERLSELEKELDQRQRVARPGGYVKGRRVEVAPTAAAVGRLAPAGRRQPPPPRRGGAATTQRVLPPRR